ncbi:MAG: GAF domain-containing sensor histidine kinase [Deltaproteobacteria bacterium]|nr:GAF domain-containing sensor histidine kinase [Deltaproteobacteria bacterium]
MTRETPDEHPATSDERPIRRWIVAEEERLLARRLRLGLLVSIGVIAAFGVADVWRHPEALTGLALVKLAQLAIVGAGLRALGAGTSRRWPRIVAAVVVCAIYVTIAAAGSLRGDAATASVLLLCGVMASAIVLPWGALAQLTTVLVASGALGVTVAASPDGAATVAGHRGLALVVAFAGSIVVAYKHARDRRARAHIAAVLAGKTEILERITGGAPLDAILTAVVTMVERHADGMLCSVLLLNGDRLRHGAAPSLPATYRDAIDGLVIGPTVGSCGTAAYRRAPVIVTDIAKDPLWNDFREVALAHGLRACWSAPILGSNRSCLGTLAMYYHEPRPPDAEDLELIESAAHLAGVAIERHRDADALAASRRLLEDESHVTRALVHAGHVMLASRTTPVVLERLARLATELLGCDCADTVVRLPGDDVYVTGSADGYAADEWESLQRVRLPPEVLAGLLDALAQRPLVQVRTADVDDAAAAALLGAHGITRSMYVTLRQGDEPIGFLSAGYRGRGERFTEQQQRIALGIGQLASMALENACLVEEARRASQLKTEFVSTMSHELRTPLSVIIGYTDMLVDDPAYNERAGILAKIRTSSVELLEMIQTTLNLSRLEAGNDLPHFERLSLRVLLDELAGEFAALPRHAGVTLRWEPAALAVRSDRRKLRIVLKNLVGNALKFTSRGEVVVSCTTVGGACAITIQDTGVGIAPEHLPAIFDMFRQGDSSDARSHGGVGLGLYIVRRLLTQLGGEVTVASERGHGTTFTVTIPLDNDESRAPRPEPGGGALASAARVR